MESSRESSDNSDLSAFGDAFLISQMELRSEISLSRCKHEGKIRPSCYKNHRTPVRQGETSQSRWIHIREPGNKIPDLQS